MSFYLVGIDEAGYGPQLGPLVVSAVIFELPDTFILSKDSIPKTLSLWRALSNVVSPAKERNKAKHNKLVVCDSKVLYQPAKGIKELEKTALSFKRLINPDYRYYNELLLPVSASQSDIENSTEMLRKELIQNSIRFCDVKTMVIETSEFNKGIEYYQNKSDFLWEISARLIQYSLDKYLSNNIVFIRAGKQGGRTYYLPYLHKLFPDRRIQIVEQTFNNSSYLIFSEPAKISASRVGISFIKDGDATEFVIALASIFAKYFRELSMIRFNYFFKSFIPSLKPTSGYPVDSKRFIRRIMPLLNKFNLDTNNFIRNK